MTIAYRTWEIKVQEFAKKKGTPIYGARALNVNINPLMRRYTSDFDLWSTKPKIHALELAKELGERYHVKRVQLPTGKFVYRVIHKSGQLTADITRVPSKERYYSRQGMTYQSLMDQKERLEEILSDPSKRFRHEKARADLRRILYTLKQLEP